MAQTQALSRLNQVPGLRQALLLVGIAASVALGIAVVMWSRTPNYDLLYSHLPAKDAAAVVQALQTADIEYRLDNNSGAILVPSGNVGRARLKLAAQGLPESGNVGVDMIGGESGFGVSDFMEKARYQQLLEKDLGQTIASLKSVKSARVHLALPKQSVFVRDRRPASASVLVDLYPGRELNRSQVAAIVHLVASSVPDLDSSQVTVVDQQGSLLTAQANGAMAVSSSHFQFRRRVERNYAHRIEQILTPLVGPGRVQAQVVAEMDFTRTERTRESYDPAKSALRSEQTSRQVRSGGGAAVGIPGALSNVPPAPPANGNSAASAANGTNAAQPADGNAQANATATVATATGASQPKPPAPRNVSTSATRNYELDRTISHVEEPVGVLRRLSVAVVIDNPAHVDANGNVVSKPLSKNELAQLTALVKDAVGFDASRGDTVSVVNAPFQTTAAAAPAVSTPQTWWKQPATYNLIKQGIGVVLALVLILAVLRPLFRSLLRPSAATPLLRAPGNDAAETDELDADQVSLSGGAMPSSSASARLNYEQKVGMAKRIAAEDPRRVAQVVKNWVGEDG